MTLWRRIFPQYVCPRCGAKLGRAEEDWAAPLFELSGCFGYIIGGLVSAIFSLITFKLWGEVVGFTVAVVSICCLALLGGAVLVQLLP